jgi:flagellar protein FlaF
MYRYSYVEILEDASETTRAREQMAFDHALELLAKAEQYGAGSPQAREALHYVQKLWNFLIENLVDPSNALADGLRADLISIGIWVIREADRILREPSGTLAGLIEVNKNMRDGLA